jgi:hypothetical protein
MKAGDLLVLTITAKTNPDLLPHMISIYRLGYNQAQIDDMKSRENINMKLKVENYGN